MKKEYLYLNGQKSVEVEYNDDIVNNVYIDGKIHDFKEEKNPNKLDYANAVKREKYRAFLNNQFENLIVLSGAGSSIGVGKNIFENNKEVERKGKIMSELWDEVEKELTKPILDRFCKLVTYKEFESEEENKYLKNLERLLSLANIEYYNINCVSRKNNGVLKPHYFFV